MRAGKFLPFVEVRLDELPDGVLEPLAPEPLLDVGEAPADATLAIGVFENAFDLGDGFVGGIVHDCLLFADNLPLTAGVTDEGNGAPGDELGDGDPEVLVFFAVKPVPMRADQVDHHLAVQPAVEVDELVFRGRSFEFSTIVFVVGRGRPDEVQVDIVAAFVKSADDIDVREDVLRRREAADGDEPGLTLRPGHVSVEGVRVQGGIDHLGARAVDRFDDPGCPLRVREERHIGEGVLVDARDSGTGAVVEGGDRTVDTDFLVESGEVVAREVDVLHRRRFEPHLVGGADDVIELVLAAVDELVERANEERALETEAAAAEAVGKRGEGGEMLYYIGTNNLDSVKIEFSVSEFV